MGKFYILNQENQRVYIGHKSYSRKFRKACFFSSRKQAQDVIESQNLKGCKIKKLSSMYMFIMDFFKKTANHERR